MGRGPRFALEVQAGTVANHGLIAADVRCRRKADLCPIATTRDKCRHGGGHAGRSLSRRTRG